MSTPPPSDRAALGRERLAARARRISLIRRRVVASVLATFVLAWGAIAWDGSMGTTNPTTAQATTSSSDATTSSSDQTSSSDDTTSSSENPTDSTSSDDSSSSDQSSAPSMTTSQS